MSDEQERQTADRVPTGVELTALDPAFRAEPYPVLARLREREPVHYDGVIKRWVLTRRTDVERVLRDRTMAVDGRKAIEGTYMRLFATPPGAPEPSMLLLDAPAHTRLRSLVNKAFTPRAVERLAPRIREISDDLLAAVAGQERFDLIEAFAGPLPVIVIAEMLGVDPADRGEFKRWSDLTVTQFNPLLTAEQRAVMVEARRQLDTYLERAIAERRAHPRDDLISALIAVEEAGDQLNDREIVTMCGLLLAAGNVTTTDLIGNGVWTLLRHPDQLRKLRDDPSLIRNAVEEILRFESPVVQAARIPMADMAIGGCPIRRGESILTSLAAANRDPSGCPEPDRFDITRPDVRHHSFGGGAHFCLGAPLARLEAQLAIGALVQRFPNLRLADELLEWRALPAFRGLAKLPRAGVGEALDKAPSRRQNAAPKFIEFCAGNGGPDWRPDVMPTRTAAKRAPGRRRTDLAGFAYARIKDLILRYEFKPGHKLAQEELAGRMGVSLTPVREALRILEKEGYVSPVRNRGFFVSEMSLKEAEELFELREALEVLAVEKAIKHRDRQFLAALETCTREYQRVVTHALTRNRILLDQRFHLLVALQADNSILVRTLEHVFERITLKRKIEGASPTRGIVAYEEHVAILDAIREGDAGRAKDLVAFHVRNAKDAVLRQLRDRRILLET